MTCILTFIKQFLCNTVLNAKLIKENEELKKLVTERNKGILAERKRSAEALLAEKKRSAELLAEKKRSHRYMKCDDEYKTIDIVIRD